MLCILSLNVVFTVHKGIMKLLTLCNRVILVGT